MVDTTDIVFSVANDNSTIKYSIPLKEYIADQQLTIKKLNAKLDSTEIKIADCNTEVLSLNKQVSSVNNIYEFLTSTNGLIIFIILIIGVFFISKRSKISFKNISIEPKSNKDNSNDKNGGSP